jgi:hypothetical protein
MVSVADPTSAWFTERKAGSLADIYTLKYPWLAHTIVLFVRFLVLLWSCAGDLDRIWACFLSRQ